MLLHSTLFWEGELEAKCSSHSGERKSTPGGSFSTFGFPSPSQKASTPRGKHLQTRLAFGWTLRFDCLFAYRWLLKSGRGPPDDPLYCKTASSQLFASWIPINYSISKKPPHSPRWTLVYVYTHATTGHNPTQYLHLLHRSGATWIPQIVTKCIVLNEIPSSAPEAWTGHI